MTTIGTRVTQPTVPRTSNHARGRLTIVDVCADLDIFRSTFYEWRAPRDAHPPYDLRHAAVSTWLSRHADHRGEHGLPRLWKVSGCPFGHFCCPFGGAAGSSPVSAMV